MPWGLNHGEDDLSFGDLEELSFFDFMGYMDIPFSHA